MQFNFIVTLVVEVVAYSNSNPSGLICEETSTSLVGYSFFPSAKPESSSRIWNGTNTIPDFTKELPILLLFSTDKSGINANSESKETPPRFNHYSNSIVSLFPHARSLESSESFHTLPISVSISTTYRTRSSFHSITLPTHYV